MTKNAAADSTPTETARWASLPEPFHFYRLMLDGDHLHFGFWPEEEPELSLEEAQQRLFERMAALLPKAPARILDVGCGLGVSAHALGLLGYEVTAIAPSDELIAYAREQYGAPNVRFEAADFLDEDAAFRKRRYDVLWFQESLQYLHPIDVLLKACQDLLEQEGGRIVLCDEVVSGNGPLDGSLVHPLRNILLGLAAAGFRVRHLERIGERVRPTCREMIRRFDGHRDMLLQAIGGMDTARRIDHYRNGWQSQAGWYETGRMNYAVLCATRDALVIRTYRDGDEERILPMFREIFGVDRSLAHWQWKFRDNPFGGGAISLAEDAQGRLAAHFCGYAVPMAETSVPRRHFITYQGGDTMTHPAFRGAGIGKDSALARTARCFYTAFCEGKTPFIYGFNTGIIRKLGERFLGYEYLPEVPYHVLEIGRLAACSVWERFLWRIRGFSVERVTRITDAYSLFFDRVSRHYGLLVERDDRYLRWRYLECPDGVHRVYALRRWGKLVGWGVFRRKGDVLAWGDALFDPVQVHALEYWLAEGLRWEHAMKERTTTGGTPVSGNAEPSESKAVCRIEAWFSPNPSWWTDALRRVGFIVKPEPHHLFPCVKRFSDQYDLQALGARWYYTWGDSDLF
ncbi:methyltransferase domain-containing protein [Desulfatirhabdium butyrativorans]|uniref:methyltransferase domain-containing protein n=1 Tax=Desulfatirhabdium butyrativorans TaxID=340467 RepID=UPI0003F4E0F1|nr:methyltransferase domain-containing protein [Desulfatirhabdium butyrativorans]